MERQRVEVVTSGELDLPTNPRENAAGAVVLSVMKKSRVKRDIRIRWVEFVQSLYRSMVLCQRALRLRTFVPYLNY